MAAPNLILIRLAVGTSITINVVPLSKEEES